MKSSYAILLSLFMLTTFPNDAIKAEEKVVTKPAQQLKPWKPGMEWIREIKNAYQTNQYFPFLQKLNLEYSKMMAREPKPDTMPATNKSSTKGKIDQLGELMKQLETERNNQLMEVCKDVGADSQLMICKVIKKCCRFLSESDTGTAKGFRLLYLFRIWHGRGQPRN